MADGNTLAPITAGALEAFRAASAVIIRETVRRSMEFSAEVEHHGAQAEQLITIGLQFTTRMLEAVMVSGQVSLLEDQMEWALERLPHDGVQAAHMANRLEIYAKVVGETLSQDQAAEIVPYFKWMIARIKTSV
ncbi:MAG: hypothetical protein WCX65_01470 [bacterium]